jgi:hypothetical protein
MQRRITRAMKRRALRGEAMQYTVAEAAQAIGKSKAGMFHIDPAELHRVILLHGSAGWRWELGGVGRRPLP